MHHPIRTRDQQLGRNGDGAGIGDDAFCRAIELQQDIDRDGARDQRVGIEGGDARRVVAQELRLDVGLHIEMPAELPHQGEARPRERHIELHLEGGRGQHQGADPGRIVMGPGRGENRADALRDDRHLLDRDAVRLGDMIDEGLNVAHRGPEAGAEAALAGRVAMAARIPGEEGEIRQVELVRQMGHAAGMLMAAMEQHDRTAWRAGCGPKAIEQLDPVMGQEFVLFDGAHDGSRV
jgi:hypothetical protein